MIYNIDWSAVIASLDLTQGESRTPDVKFYLNTDGKFDQMISTWKAAGYDKSNSVEWINYYPERHYPMQLVEHFATWSNTKYARSWISRIRPGKMAPFHQDIDDRLDEYLAIGPLIRYSICISPPAPGSLFLLNDQVFHLNPQGTVIEWPHYLDWHAGTNCGFHDQFMFHYLGVKHG